MKSFLKISKTAAFQFIVLGLLMAMEPAMAGGLDKAMSTAQMIQTGLSMLSVTSGSIALMYSGYKMMFQSAKWAEIANVVYGSVFVSGATGISAWLMA